MNHSQHTNYQTSFQIIRKDDQTYSAAIRSVFDWICNKERDKSLTDGWKEFSVEGNWDHCYQTKARIQTATWIEDQSKRAWAMEYTHADQELGAKRFWHTYVGIRDTGETLVISARVAYSWNNEDLDEAPAPSPSVPKFIRLLVDKFTAYSGRKEFRLIKTPLILGKMGGGNLVRDFVFSPERRYPLIVFNGNSDAHLKESKHLAKVLAGKAQVVLVTSLPGLSKEMEDAFPRDYRVRFGFMRVFFPMGSSPKTPKRHRWFDVNTDDYESQREGIVHGLLRNHNLIERESVTNVAEIHRMITKSRIKELNKDATSSVSEEKIKAEFQEYIAALEIELDSFKNEAQHYALQIDELASALLEAKWKNITLTESISTKSDDTNVASMFFKLPTTLQDVVEIASKLHSDKLIFAQEAFVSAKANAACELVADAWHICSHLASTLHEIIFKDEDSGDIAKRFEERSGFEYVKTEGKQTKANSKQCTQREITHDGKKYKIWPHIKKGNGGNKMIRIHFDFDHENKKIVIGFVGLHMDNATTRKL